MAFLRSDFLLRLVQVSAVCSLSDFRPARSLSLSVGAWLPSAAPDSARALDWAAADFCLANSVGGGGRAMGSAPPPAGGQHRGEGVSAVCSLSDFRPARSLSLSVGAWLPSAAPDFARALDWAAADFCLANSVGGGGRAMGSAPPPAGGQHRGEGSPPCALSQISGRRESLSLSVGAWLPSAAPDNVVWNDPVAAQGGPVWGRQPQRSGPRLSTRVVGDETLGLCIRIACCADRPASGARRFP